MKQKLLSVLLSISLLNISQAQTVWNGPSVTFTKVGFADFTLPANQDRITASTWITRGNTQGIYNIFSESAYSELNGSPQNTEWAYGTLANYASLIYQPWKDWAFPPPSTIGQPAVLHLIAENIYIGITFLSWDSRVAGGGAFSYQRTTASSIITPVKLVSFAAAKKNKTLELNWKTASEENTSSFSIERSSDGKQFSSIGTLAASGNTTTEKNYSFTDVDPLPANFYRLRINDNNGAVSYSQIVAVKMGKQKGFEIFPVPATTVLHVQLNTSEKNILQLIDITGRVRKCITLAAGDNAFSIDIIDLQAGVYFLKAGRESKLFIKE